jgi:hypothetical protein
MFETAFASVVAAITFNMLSESLLPRRRPKNAPRYGMRSIMVHLLLKPRLRALVPLRATFMEPRRRRTSFSIEDMLAVEHDIFPLGWC